MQELGKYAVPNTELLPDRNARLGVAVQVGIAVQGENTGSASLRLMVKCQTTHSRSCQLVEVRSVQTTVDVTVVMDVVGA